MDEHIFTVSEIAQEVRRVIERFIAPVWIKGEVSNFSFSRSGHIYFSLKDQQALINCVIWRNVAYSIPFQINNGMQLLVFGAVTTYAPQSQYQVNVQKVRPAGLGDLHLAFEALKKKLAAEGLFAQERKRPIPAFPEKVGLITSPSGAAVNDFLKISERRNPSIAIYIYPAQVQGEGAADTIIKGIEYFNVNRAVDFIVLARGGGSLEDLWAFNEEKLVRAIAASALPVVSAVGHEVDFTLSDFVADLRAPTPSAAAELVIPDRAQIITRIGLLKKAFCKVVTERLTNQQTLCLHYLKRLQLYRPLSLLQQRRQRLDELEIRLLQAVKNLLASRAAQLEGFIHTFAALDPRAILKRGYAIVYHLPEERMIKTVQAVKPQSSVAVELYDGKFSALVEKIMQNKSKE